MTPLQVEKFQNDLLTWFERNARDLPWRRDRDPYRIWVSEIMLQQTRVDTVIPYYERFMEKFPTLEALAAADESDVYKQWEGLGYYSRARNLHEGVKEVQEKYGGRVPDTPEEIRTIKGIGPYTSGAVLSIAYGLPEPAVDGNVMRVLSRVRLIEEDIQKQKTRRLFEDIIRSIISRNKPSFFNQALMELGALICTPKSPACLHCPVQEHCQARAAGVQERLPVKGKAKPPRPVQITVGYLENNGRFFIRRRPDTGLLAGLWELPGVEGNEEDLLVHMEETYGTPCRILSRFMSLTHTFSHLQWQMNVCHLELVNEHAPEQGRWIKWEDKEQYAFPVPYQKILKEIYLEE